MELTEACSSREWCGWQRWQISAILVLCQVDGWNLSSQVAHQLLHPLVITLHVYQYLELRLPPVGGSGFDMQHIYSEILGIMINLIYMWRCLRSAEFKLFSQFHAVHQLTECTVLSLSDKSRVSHFAAYFRAVAKVLLHQCSVAMEKALEHPVFLYGNCANSFPTRSVALNFTPLPITKHSLCLAMTLGCTSVGTWNLRTAGTGPQKIPCYSTECHYMMLKLVWSATSASEMPGAVFETLSSQRYVAHTLTSLGLQDKLRLFSSRQFKKFYVLLRESFWWH
jgi:hypothetical protein